MAKAQTLNYEQLRRASFICNELSSQGFVLNVLQSFREGFITAEEKHILLSPDWKSNNDLM